MEFGYESMKHAGSLKWGGGGEGSYADFKSHQFNAVLRIDLDDAGSHAGREFGDGSDHSDHDAGSSGHATHFGHGGMAPAGVLFSHMLEHQGEWMLGYRYMYRRQAGDVMQGTHPVRDPATVAGACATDPCYIKPTSMNMHMHMLEAMVALSDSVTLMLMPQFVDMNMSMRPLDGSPPSPGMGDPVGAAIMHAGHPHTTGGIGDTELHALFALRRDLEREWILGLGLSAPTGDVGVKLRPVMGYKLGYIEYGMQLGSGTWDFKPSLTYTEGSGKLHWGAQLSGTLRMQDHNKSGFAFGDIFQTTAWGSYEIADGIAASLRGICTRQGKIKGSFSGTFVPIGPGDYGANYGGRFGDVGLGLTAALRNGNHVGIEWLRPVKDNVNGYQLERKGSLAVNWSIQF